MPKKKQALTLCRVDRPTLNIEEVDLTHYVKLRGCNSIMVKNVHLKVIKWNTEPFQGKKTLMERDKATLKLVAHHLISFMRKHSTI